MRPFASSLQVAVEDADHTGKTDRWSPLMCSQNNTNVSSLFSHKSLFSCFLKSMKGLGELICASERVFGTLGFSFSVVCLPCLGPTGSGGVSWEEICGVIQPGPSPVWALHKSCQMNGNPITAPHGKLAGAPYKSGTGEAQRRHQWPVIYRAYMSVFPQQKCLCWSGWQSSRVFVLCILLTVHLCIVNQSVLEHDKADRCKNVWAKPSLATH